MHIRSNLTRCLWFGFGLLTLAAVGCGKQAGGYDAYLPGEDASRQALVAALDAWKSGRAIGKVEGQSMQVDVVDSKWQAGQKLADYKIVKAETGNGPTRFSVRIKLKSSSAEQEVGYVVIGKSPQLWVYRDEDYRKVSGM